MDAQQYLNEVTESGRIVRFARWLDSECTGRGRGLILDRDQCIAVLIEDCGVPSTTHEGLAAGAIVHYYESPDAPSDRVRVVDRPAYVQNQHRSQRPTDWPPS